MLLIYPAHLRCYNCGHHHKGVFAWRNDSTKLPVTPDCDNPHLGGLEDRYLAARTPEEFLTTTNAKLMRELLGIEDSGYVRRWRGESIPMEWFNHRPAEWGI